MILTSLFKRSSQSVHPRDPILADIWGQSNVTASGVRVTTDSALGVVAFYAAVRIIAESVAALPLVLYRRKSDDSREVARRNPLYRLLHNQPNNWQTSFEWREMKIAHALLRGAAYDQVIYDNAGNVRELIPLHPDRVTPFRAPNGEIAFVYRPLDGPERVLLSWEVHRIQGLTLDGLKALDPVHIARQALGLTLAADEFGARFFGNGTVIGGYLKHPHTLSDDAQKRLIRAWEERHQGPSRSHRPAVLEEGMEWQSIGIDPEKAQFLQTRKYQVAEIARMFRIPPHMLADLERSTNNNIEHQSTEFVVHTLRPWLVRHEQAIWRDLLSTEGQRQFYAEYKVEGLLRGDQAARADFYQKLWNVGALSPNDILRLENMDPFEGGDSHYVPMNFVPVGETRDLYPLLRHAYQKIVTAQVRGLRRELEAAESPEEFRGRAARFLADHAHFVVRHLQPIYASLGRADVNDYARAFVVSTGEMIEQAQDVRALLDEWDMVRACELALHETGRIGVRVDDEDDGTADA